MDSPAAVSCTHLPQSQCFAYPDYYVDNLELHPIQLLTEFIKPHYRVGTELDNYYCKARNYFELIKLVNDQNNIVDISQMTNLVRQIKSPLELDIIRQAAKVADLAMEAAVKSIKAGSKISEAAGEIIKA